jgi:hypothetical protein
VVADPPCVALVAATSRETFAQTPPGPPARAASAARKRPPPKKFPTPNWTLSWRQIALNPTRFKAKPWLHHNTGRTDPAPAEDEEETRAYKDQALCSRLMPVAKQAVGPRAFRVLAPLPGCRGNARRATFTGRPDLGNCFPGAAADVTGRQIQRYASREQLQGTGALKTSAQQKGPFETADVSTAVSKRS